MTWTHHERFQTSPTSMLPSPGLTGLKPCRLFFCCRANGQLFAKYDRGSDHTPQWPVGPTVLPPPVDRKDRADWYLGRSQSCVWQPAPAEPKCHLHLPMGSSCHRSDNGWEEIASRMWHSRMAVWRCEIYSKREKEEGGEGPGPWKRRKLVPTNTCKVQTHFYVHTSKASNFNLPCSEYNYRREWNYSQSWTSGRILIWLTWCYNCHINPPCTDTFFLTL